MGLVRKKWSAEEADEWTREDTFAVIVSPIIYVLITIGTVFSVLLVPIGYALLAAGVLLLVLLVAVIDPKLSAVSRMYERRQRGYLEELERKVKWEE